MKDLSGRVAVVTGAASGIGLALCRALATRSMKIVLADVEESALQVAAAEIAGLGVEVLPVVCDVSLAPSVESLAEETFETFGSCHVLCNNAGVATGGAIWDQPLAQWEWVVGVNLWGVVHGVRAFVPKMVEHGEGHVVNTASMAGLVPLPMSAPYTVTKHGVVGLSEALYFELRLTGSPVAVSVLCPGWVNTNIGESNRNWPDRLGPNPAFDTGSAGEAAHQLMQSVLAQGMAPSDVAELVVGAIDSGKFWILTHPEMGKAVTDRYRRAVDGENPEFAFGGLVPGFQ